MIASLMASLIRHALEHAATLERQMAADANRRPDFPTVDLDGIEAARPEALAEMACLCTEALAALYPHSSPKTEWFRVLKEHHCGGPTRLSEVPAGGTAGGLRAVDAPARKPHGRQRDVALRTFLTAFGYRAMELLMYPSRIRCRSSYEEILRSIAVIIALKKLFNCQLPINNLKHKFPESE